jgi:hypothetical protein
MRITGADREPESRSDRAHAASSSDFHGALLRAGLIKSDGPADLGRTCAAVADIGGYGMTVTVADDAAKARAAASRGAVGGSVFEWTRTSLGIWPSPPG